jgi:two-component system response regulator HydG
MEKKIKVLVVDDDRRMVKTICDILQFKGYETEQAYCGEDAVEKAKEDGLDCVLMDLKMPGIDGIETLKIIKEMRHGLPVMLMSAYATLEQSEEAKREGAHALLAKPIDIQAALLFISQLKEMAQETG